MRLKSRPHITGEIVEQVSWLIMFVNWDNLSEPSNCHVDYLEVIE